jgi:hypothetical protein
MSHSSRQTVLFPVLFDKPLEVAFDEPHLTSDGGAVVLKAIDDRLGLTAAMTRGLVDDRQPGKVVHSLEDLFRQRVFGLACGYADANDVARIGADPVHKILIGRDPLADPDLASQATISRFENAIHRTGMYRMSEGLLQTVLDTHRRRLPGRKMKRITIDMDPTEDPTHGQQEFAFFNGHYDSWCYLPMLCHVTFNREPEQYLVAAVLRSGKAGAKEGAIGVLRRVILELRWRFPSAQIRVRLDGGFAGPEMFDFLEEQEVEYVVAMARNSVLERRARRAMNRSRRRSKKTGKTAREFGETWYAARSWKGHQRRVIYKAEVVRLEGRSPRDNCRFVVTNLPYVPSSVYEIYRQRGDEENRIKEIKAGLYLDRTSCTRFWANQLRVLMAAAAYVLLQELRRKLSTTSLGRAQVETLRVCLLKIGGRLKRTVRRLVLHLSLSHPWQDDWLRAARLFSAQSP